SFDDGAFASLLYSGYAHFDSDEICGGIGELGAPKDASQYGSARRNLRRAANADQEATLKNARNYGGADYAKQPSAAAPSIGGTDDARWHQHFGWILVSCERADLRPLPMGVMVYGDDEARLDPLPRPQVPRAEVSDTQRLLRHWRDAVPNDRMAHLVKDATRALVRSLQTRLARHDVSFGHWTFLRILWETDGLTQRELSREAGVMEPTTFAALKAMESRGYIVRRQLAGNRRKVHIFLTIRGRALKRTLVPLAEAVNRAALRRVTSADIAATRRTLMSMLVNLARDELRSLQETYSKAK